MIRTLLTIDLIDWKLLPLAQKYRGPAIGEALPISNEELSSKAFYTIFCLQLFTSCKYLQF